MDYISESPYRSKFGKNDNVKLLVSCKLLQLANAPIQPPTAAYTAPSSISLRQPAPLITPGPAHQNPPHPAHLCNQVSHRGQNQVRASGSLCPCSAMSIEIESNNNFFWCRLQLSAEATLEKAALIQRCDKTLMLSLNACRSVGIAILELRIAMSEFLRVDVFGCRNPSESPLMGYFRIRK